MLRHTQILLWRTAALISVALGGVGLLLPVMPTVPFLIVGAWAAGRGWPQLEQWLLAHPTYGEPIRHWRARRAIPRYAKWLSTVMMATSAVGLQFFPVVSWLRIGVPVVMFCVAIWIWTRPDA